MLREIALSALLALTVAGSAAADQWEKKFAVSGRPTFVLRCDDARVYVTSGSGGSVGVLVTTTGWSIGPRGVRVEATQVGNRVECEVREPRLTLDFGFHRRTARVDVSLPRDADVDVTTGDGSVTLGSLRGVERVHTGDGAIDVAGLQGELHLSASDGRIRGRELDGALEARTSDGSMEIEGRFDRLDLESSDGHVEASALPGSRVATGWSLRSSDGGLTLRVPPDLAADLDLRAGDGSIQLDLPVQVTGTIQRHALRGQLNGGGALIEMRSGDGPIRLVASAADAGRARIVPPKRTPAQPPAPGRPPHRRGGQPDTVTRAI